MSDPTNKLYYGDNLEVERAYAKVVESGGRGADAMRAYLAMMEQ